MILLMISMMILRVKDLTRLFQKCPLLGSRFITLRKYDSQTQPIPTKGSVEGIEPSDNKCLLRATDDLLRANTDGLKKRD
ncbi:unnamed protein product [Nyctereutes procyonoides]|uniref:Signal recognition particle 14 kDa protein n=1 Tax=Nyctereutes procyonoides TaxID=34880 RepID=A0A811YNZ9_NYCPR|nr:unnamed protein product [Nyctereutes procyonoides]